MLEKKVKKISKGDMVICQELSNSFLSGLLAEVINVEGETVEILAAGISFFVPVRKITRI